MNVQVINRTYEELRACIEQAQVLASKANLTPQEIRLHSTLLAKVSLLKAGISADELRAAEMERLAKMAGLESPDELRAKRFVRTDAELRDWYDFIKYGEKRTDYQSTAQWGRPSGESYSDNAGAGAGSQGGVLVPANFQEKLFASMATYDEIIDPENCNLWESTNGAAATTPAVDDATGSPVAFNKATRLGETVQSAAKPVPFKAVKWGATPSYRSGVVLVSYEIEQDSFEPWVKLLESVFAQRTALGFGAECITGAGTLAVGGTPTIPLGLVTAIQSGSKQTSASSTLALSDLENLYHGLSKVYRAGAKFYMSDNTKKLVTKLFDTANRAMWDADAESMFGHDIVTCNSMTDWAAGADSAIVFANPNFLLQRRVKNGSYVRRYTQTPNYVEAGLFGYESFVRADFQPILFDAAASFAAPVAALSAHA